MGADPGEMVPREEYQAIKAAWESVVAHNTRVVADLDAALARAEQAEAERDEAIGAALNAEILTKKAEAERDEAQRERDALREACKEHYTRIPAEMWGGKEVVARLKQADELEATVAVLRAALERIKEHASTRDGKVWVMADTALATPRPAGEPRDA